MEYNIVTTTLTLVAKTINMVKDNFTNYYTTKSLSDATKLTRVEPLTIVSKDCVNLECIQDVLHCSLNIFSAYYLQAVSILTRVDSVRVVKILDRLNPDRDDTGFLMIHQDGMSQEAYRTLCLENYKYSLPTHAVPAMESDTDNAKAIMDLSNLAVGKLLHVRICYDDAADGKNKTSIVEIPVNVRLMTSVIPTSTISHLLSSKTEDTSLIERYHAWRSGRVAFIKDLIFCQDLIDEQKRSIIGDQTGTVAEIMRRVNNSKKYGLITKNPSLVSASNLFVITEEVAREIESKLGGKLSNPRIREKAFNNTYAMLIVVIDREYERVTFYTRGISSSTDLSFKEIKASGKGSSNIDIGDVLKSLTMGNSPSF